MIGTWLERQDDIVLARLASVKPENWDRSIAYYNDPFRDKEGDGCLMCHAFSCQTTEEYMLVPRIRYEYPAILSPLHFEPEAKYMSLGARLGNERTGELISRRAEAILIRRYTAPVIEELISHTEAVLV